MSKRVIVLTRDVSVADISLLRYMKLVHKEDIHKLETDADKLEFVIQLVNDLGNENGFANYTTTGVRNLTPSTFYARLCSNHKSIPSFYLATMVDGKYSKIERVTPRGLAELVKDIKEQEVRDERYRLRQGESDTHQEQIG